MQDVFKRLTKHLEPDTSVPTAVMLGKEGYATVPFALEHFHAIEPAAPGTIAFIDGGNAELSSGANFSLHFIRTAAVIGKKIIQEEAFCLVRAIQENGTLVYRTELLGIEGIRLPTIDVYEPSLAEGNHRVQPSRVAELARTLAELRLAAWVMPELPKGAFLVRDGDLHGHTIYEQNALRELYERARMQGVTVAGVSKTSTLLMDTGHGALAYLLAKGPSTAWLYHPIASSTRPDHQASVGVAKLHARANHAFRIDIHDEHLPFLNALLAQLAVESQDAAFLGYPYGLTEADRYARVSEDERQLLRAKIEVFFGQLKAQEASQNAHDALNKAV
ncbi:DNA double-strand break repair nuclease NurA [Candidatus Woesearchaeota archaeon]|nr:DNA double-strand break repair nuclease NurA [Candidatus Woesearchaeota archaeon]